MSQKALATWANGERRGLAWIERRTGRDHSRRDGDVMPKSKGKEDPGPSVKDPEMYEALRDDGASKEKAARIANAAANSSRSEVGRRGGEVEDYDDRTVDELRERAAELDIEGRSSMSKDELIAALRNH